MLGEVEAPAAAIIQRLIGGLSGQVTLTDAELATLALFASFQVARTPRRRREMELQGEWYAKTMARGRVPEADLKSMTIAPHQNDLVRMIGTLAEELAPFFHARPLALVTLDRPLLLIGDDPVVINPGADEVHHNPDCLLTDEQLAERDRRNRRRHRRHGRHGRIAHFWSPVPSGVGTALELILPVSPRSALVWGELSMNGPPKGLEQGLLAGDEADRFAELLNDATCERALDWVVAKPADPSFTTRVFAPHGPLVRVCDGENAASLALNTTPSPIRPHRLTKPAERTDRR